MPILTSPSKQRPTVNKKISIFKKRSTKSPDQIVYAQEQFNSSVIQNQAELFDSTFINEVNEYNELLQGVDEPEKFLKSLVEDKNKNKIF
jgi:hypothetical protein